MSHESVMIQSVAYHRYPRIETRHAPGLYADARVAVGHLRANVRGRRPTAHRCEAPAGFTTAMAGRRRNAGNQCAASCRPDQGSEIQMDAQYVVLNRRTHAQKYVRSASSPRRTTTDAGGDREPAS
jgi:hypothetical protein